ncbi:MAG TPA: alkaline phosphatase family protein [Candidatus Binataceae bacterium]|nr:alkaline phosphatase family protein [Candidatus Binataceae bacterium]
MKSAKTPKLAMIGVDAAEFSFIKTHLANLPNFSRILSHGVLRQLSSTSALLNGSVWPSFYTASNPSDHGIYHHIQWDPELMKIRRVTPEWLPAEPFYAKLERKGVAVTALDVPVSMRTHLNDGIEITNFGVHDPFAKVESNQPGLIRDLLRRFGAHPMGCEIPVAHTEIELSRIRDDLMAGAKLKGEVSRWLLGARQSDFFITVFAECHRAGHTLWPDGLPSQALPPSGAALEVYRKVDEGIGVILDALDLSQTTLMLFSLHGMGVNNSKNYFLQQIMDRVNVGFAAREPAVFGSTRPKQHGLIRGLLEVVPASMQNFVASHVPAAVKDAVVDRSYTAGHDWAHTPAIGLRSDWSAYIRFNLRGREREGMLDDDMRRHYEDWMRQCFMSLRDADTDEPVVNEIHLTNSESSGACSPLLPDAIVTWTPIKPPSRIVSSLIGSLEGELTDGRRGNHRSDGFLITMGPGFDHGTVSQPLHITEVASMVFEQLIG